MRDISPPSRPERIKLLAAYLNTIGAGFAVTGVVGPIASYLYGTTSQTARPAWELGVEAASLLLFSGGMHYLANRVLGRLDR